VELPALATDRASAGTGWTRKRLLLSVTLSMLDLVAGNTAGGLTRAVVAHALTPMRWPKALVMRQHPLLANPVRLCSWPSPWSGSKRCLRFSSLHFAPVIDEA